MKSKNRKDNRRQQKREQEIRLIVNEISKFISADFKDKSLKILEFGCGAGYQTRHLQKLGNVIATDIYTHENITKKDDVKFIQTSIVKTHFEDNEFDLLFSNHVIEHIREIAAAFDELQRIGRDDCLFAFCVPTNIWLLLSIPSQINGKIQLIIKKMFSAISHREPVKPSRNDGEVIFNEGTPRGAACDKDSSGGFLKKISLTGHGGVYTEWFDCYKHFRVKVWKKLLEENNFSILKIKPILLYSPAEFPIIPTMKPISTLCSSVLFIMKKSTIDSSAFSKNVISRTDRVPV